MEDKQFLVAVLALLCGTVVSTTTTTSTPVPATDIEPLQQEVTEGDSFHFVCKAAGPISSCVISTPSGEAHKLNPEEPQYASTYGMIYHGEGFEDGQCGFQMFMAVSELNGTYTCRMNSTAEEIEGTMKLSVKHKPLRPTLSLDHEDRKYLEGETLEATCKVTSFGPPAIVTWFLNSEALTEGVQPYSLWSSTPGKQNLKQQLVRVVTKEDHGKTLRCVAEHPVVSWDRGLDGEAEVQFSVRPVT